MHTGLQYIHANKFNSIILLYIRTLAVGSFEVLQNAKVYNSLEESLADLNKVCVCTVHTVYSSIVLLNELVFMYVCMYVCMYMNVYIFSDLFFC